MFDARTTIPHLLLSLLLLAGGACLADPDVLDDEDIEIGSDNSAISGGSVVPTGQLEAVVKIGSFPSLFKCSGTLITDRLVLTAAHCTAGGRESIWFINVRRVDNPNTPGDESANRQDAFINGDAFVHPDFSIGSRDANDIAVVRLDRPASEVVMVSPIPFSGTLPTVGSNVTIVGYGKANGPGGECDPGVVGTKRRATTAVDGIESHGPGDLALELDDQAIHACEGDSGGPAIDALGRVVGISSEGDFVSVSRYRAVAAYQEWIGLQGSSPGGRVGAWDLSGSAPAASVYADRVPDGNGLLGWIDDNDLRLVGDFLDREHDQVLYVNTGGVGGFVRIADYADGVGPTDSAYWLNYGQFSKFTGWFDANDVQLVGDFLARGHDQLLLINNSGSGGRVMIVDFASGDPQFNPQFILFELYGQSNLLNGWHDVGDGFLVGKFFGQGFDCVLFVNRGPGAGRILIADFRDGATPIDWRYYQAYSDGPQLNGWHDAGDLMFAGDFRGFFRDQVLFVNRGPGDGRVLVVDFGHPTIPAKWELYVDYAHAAALNGWLDNEDLALAGSFRGGVDQLALINRTSAGLDRVRVADFSGAGITVPFNETHLMTSGLVPRVIQSSDRVLAGDVRGSGSDQLVTLEVLEQ